MKDNRIVKYNMDFCFREFKYEEGAVRIDLYDVNEMHGYIIAPWTLEYAGKHLREVLKKATGIGGGWSFPLKAITPNKFNKDIYIYDFTITSRLYNNLRRIYERKH